MRQGMLRLLGFAAVLLQGLAQAGAQPVRGCPWPAVDSLRRTCPVEGEAPKAREGRSVGIFYFLWLSAGFPKSPHWDGPADISQVLLREPNAVSNPNCPFWGGMTAFHFWGKPLYGYYDSRDPWVLRRHAMLLSDAGIDVLILDATNGLTYPEVYNKLCEVFSQMRREVNITPQIAFMINSHPQKTVQKLFDDLYKPGRHRELWYLWHGKPLLLCDPAAATPEIRSFFTLRKAHWPFALVNTPNAWHWEAAYPQCYGYTDDPNKPEQLNVSVAQNLRVADAKVTCMSTGEARGRSFHDGKVDRRPDAVNEGLNFQEQWKRAFELDPPFVMVTGWNEWVAQRYATPAGQLSFCDQFSQEASRDVEPMQGGHFDNYYYQLVTNVRRYKGVPSVEKASPPVSMPGDGSFEWWRSVRPTFSDWIGDTTPRDFAGAGGQHYTERSGRNDIVACKVARNASNVFFYLETKKPIQPAGRWDSLWLLINADQNAATGWEGVDFLIGRVIDQDGVLIESNAGGWNWKPAGKASYRIAGNRLQVTVPRKTLGLQEGNSRLAIDFKWFDNAREPGSVADWYSRGDIAPEGRFFFRYCAE